MTVRSLIILGAGRNSVEILDLVADLNESAGRPGYACVGILDDNEALWGQEIDHVRVRGPLAAARDFPDAWFVNAIASPAVFWKKDAILARTGIPPDRFVTLVHPSASVSRAATLGRGTIVFQNVTVCSHAVVGDQVLIRPNGLLSHDTVIGDGTCIAGGACVSGMAHVGRLCYLGTNCSLREGVRIGDRSMVGMGSVVLQDVPGNSVVWGNPARFQRHTCPAGGEGRPATGMGP